MKKYKVSWIEYHIYEVEAENEEKAFDYGENVSPEASYLESEGMDIEEV